MNDNDVKNLHLVFSLAIKNFGDDRQAVKGLIDLEERLIKLINDEHSGDEANNGTRG